MYDMYAWDRSARETAPADESSENSDHTDHTEASPEPQPAVRAVRAVQIALDRRDNGGPATAPVANAAR